MDQVTVSRRERNKEATRLALHNAALELTEERGLASVTVEAITERADVAPRTFSNYFACKEDAVLGIDPWTSELLAGALAARPETETPFEALRAVLIDHMTSRFRPQESAQRRIRVVRTEPSLKARMAGQFDQLTAGLVKVIAQRMDVDPEGDLYPTLITSAGANTVRSAVLWWSAQPPPGPDLEEVLVRTFDQLAAGLATACPAPPRRIRKS